MATGGGRYQPSSVDPIDVFNLTLDVELKDIIDSETVMKNAESKAGQIYVNI